jgi:uncharacterized protein YkwD
VRVKGILSAALPVLLAGATTFGAALPAAAAALPAPAGAAETGGTQLAPSQAAPVVETLGAADAASPDGQSFLLLNGVRADLGLPALRYDTGLSAYAIAHAQAMARAGSLYHSDIASLLGHPWWNVGENVGVGGSVYQVHVAFVYSAGHYANIRNPSFTAVGVGVAADVYGRLFICHVFAA